MAKLFATLIDEIQSDLGDDTTTYTDAKVTIQLEKAIKAVSGYMPFVMMHTFALESRTGADTAGTTDKLTDGSNDQFLATDVGKVIYNTTDNTWAVVTAYDDVDVLSISKDIMASGESYKMFNKGCWDIKQINIEDVTDYIGEDHGVIAVEYKTQKSTKNYRNFTVEGDILTIDIDFSPPDSKVATSGDQPDVEVFVWFETRHRVVQFADIQGTVSGTPAAGATTFTIAAVGSGSDIITEGSLFTVAGVRGTYTVQYDLTLSGGGGTLRFWPGLESAPANGALVTFISGVSYGSTLDSRLERLVVELGAAYCALSLQANAISKGGQGVYRRYESKLAIALLELERLQVPMTKRTWPKD